MKALDKGKTLQDKRKILLLIDGLGSGGTEHQICYLASALQKRGYPVELTYFSNVEPFYADLLKSAGVAYRCCQKGISRLRRPWEIAKIVRKERPQAVIAYKDGAAMGASLAKLFAKFHLIVSERNTTQTLDRRERLKFFSYRFADWIVPNSISQEHFIQEHYPGLCGKVRTIRNMVDLQRFQPLREEKAEWGQRRILVFARLMRQKNVLRFLDALSLLKKEGCDFKAEWYGSTNGDEDYVKEIEHRRKQLGLEGQIEFKAHVSQTWEVYPQADIFCLPSLFEGFPNVVCEAMACGLPIACSNVCDNPSLVEEGVNGAIFDPLSAAEIAGGLKKLLQLSGQELKDMGKANRKKMEEICSEDAFAEAYTSLISR